jgi:hypothetical protein
MANNIYAPPRTVTDITDCHFYHTIDLPSYGEIRGEWDLRAGVDAYLGNIDLASKRLLEAGTASGFLCFEMEKRGAEVVGYDLSAKEDWDIIPYGGKNDPDFKRSRKELIDMINNAWWFTHAILGSHARMVYGSIYEIPEAIGPVQVSPFGSILLHLRDPFLALQKAANLTTETMIVTEVLPIYLRIPLSSVFWKFLAKLHPKFESYFTPLLNFMPDPEEGAPSETWWNLSPSIVCRFLKILGFTQLSLNYHNQIHYHGPELEYKRVRSMYTVVGSRPHPRLDL